MKNYRIPTIDEFTDGFTFEVYADGCFQDCVEDFEGWYRYTIGLDNWRFLDDIERELVNNNIRVEL
jgi:hypothetical protein